MIKSRALTTYFTIGRTFGRWISPITSALFIVLLKILIFIGNIFDFFLYRNSAKQNISILVIVGNPRSGTTFLHRFLINQGFGTGAQLWQMVYPALSLQKVLKPLLPLLEKISPARHHSTTAHKTSLTSFETDDVSLLFKYFDGFFLYGFFLAFHEQELFDWFDPNKRNTNERDFRWFESFWKKLAFASQKQLVIPKLFSLSTNLPAFQKRFPEARIIYMLRDPANVIPSGLSLVTGVLDKRFGFWNLEKDVRDRYLNRLYLAFVELLKRFHDDWINGKIDRSKVYIVQYDKMMNQFESVMDEILQFADLKTNEMILKNIQQTASSQRTYASEHHYELEKFGLTVEQIKTDCAFVYDTFLNAK